MKVEIIIDETKINRESLLEQMAMASGGDMGTPADITNEQLVVNYISATLASNADYDDTGIVIKEIAIV